MGHLAPDLISFRIDIAEEAVFLLFMYPGNRLLSYAHLTPDLYSNEKKDKRVDIYICACLQVKNI